MNLSQNKTILTQLRSDLINETSDLHFEFKSELVELINALIGRINCYSTDEASELERLAKQDGLRDAR